ncbi:RNA 2',3'-cyclic phosphodiesterase [Calidifontibacillus oryziterrae]|uniref:RNA 2',3'-cyclic phosphodiesterase n=1 Tax=Calidifontibacillus oryziterrae TaxID=1191699 RepID=UPI000301A938|nr:RNA 2',3'-cyclic phosphodiesterase [Calidifontibacillus oryziterrae]
MSNFPHYFIAIPLPEHIKDYFSVWQSELQHKLSYKIWPHKQDLHITLKFLGAVSNEQLQVLKQELVELENFQAFNLTVGKVGTFGNPKNPRVLWAEVEKVEALLTLQKVVDECSINVGFPKENREYNPHITLAKKYSGDSSAFETVTEIKRCYTNQQVMNVDEVVIYQIFPSKNPKYEVVQRYLLRKDSF